MDGNCKLMGPCFKEAIETVGLTILAVFEAVIALPCRIYETSSIYNDRFLVP